MLSSPFFIFPNAEKTCVRGGEHRHLLILYEFGLAWQEEEKNQKTFASWSIKVDERIKCCDGFHGSPSFVSLAVSVFSVNFRRSISSVLLRDRRSRL